MKKWAYHEHHARSVELEQHLIDNKRRASPRPSALFSMLAGINRAAHRTIGERDLNKRLEVNHNLSGRGFCRIRSRHRTRANGRFKNFFASG
jgi:hypothetical protein